MSGYLGPHCDLEPASHTLRWEGEQPWSIASDVLTDPEAGALGRERPSLLVKAPAERYWHW